MKNILFFFLCLYSVGALAQDCDKEALKTLPGSWLPQPSYEIESGTPKPSAADASGAKQTMNKIGQMFRDQYKPVGVDVYDYLTHNITKDAYANSYLYTVSNFRFLCINGKRTKNSEGVSSAVRINPVQMSGQIQFLDMPMNNERGELSAQAENGFGFYALSPLECKGGKLPDFSNGYHTVESRRNYYVWITRVGKQPYRYVSRKEFLEKQVALLEARRKERKPGDSKEFLSSFFEKPLEAYRQDLKKDQVWLNEKAVIKEGVVKDPATNAFLYSRYVFTDLNDPAMAVPIISNPDYYDRSLPKWAPQFIIVDIGRTDEFIGQNIRKVVDNNIDFFKNLLVSK